MTFSYDKAADVLYVQIEDHPEPDCDYVEPTEGVVYRVSSTGRVVGVTIIGFSTLAAGDQEIVMPFAIPHSGIHLAEA